MTFNLLDEPWIPVETLDGDHRDVGLRALFADAANLRRIDAGDPLADVALLRLVLAATYGTGAYTVRTTGDWTAMHDDLRHGASVMTAYLESWHDRFDLFDPVNPFMQVAGLTLKGNNRTGLARLDVNRGLNHRAHTDPYTPVALTPGEAAIRLVTLQSYDSAGVRNQVEDQPKNWFKSRGQVAWCGGIETINAEGETLADTIALNHASPKAFEGLSDATWADDKPVWERDPLPSGPVKGFDTPKTDRGDRSYMRGPATLMTWQPRRVRLITDPQGTVVDAIIANGDVISPLDAWPMETMAPWNKPSKPDAKPSTIRPVIHAPSMTLWRGIAGIMPSDTHANPPVTLLWIRDLKDAGVLDPAMPVGLRATRVRYGTSNAVLDSMGDDRLDMTLAMLTADDWLRELLEKHVARAANMTDAAWLLERRLLIDCRRHQLKTEDLKDFSLKMKPRVTIRAWSMLDRPFRDMLATVRDPDDMEDALDTWETVAFRLFRDFGDTLAREAGAASARGRMNNGEYVNAGTVLERYRRDLNLIREDKWNTGRR